MGVSTTTWEGGVTWPYTNIWRGEPQWLQECLGIPKRLRRSRDLRSERTTNGSIDLTDEQNGVELIGGITTVGPDEEGNHREQKDTLPQQHGDACRGETVVASATTWKEVTGDKDVVSIESVNRWTV